MLTFDYKFDDPISDEQVDLRIDIDEESLLYVAAPLAEPPAWTALEFEKCSHCPLDPDEHPQCPIAANIAPIVQRFEGRTSHEPVVCTVTGPERTYVKALPIQNGLCAVIGLIMATSRCPYMEFLRPLARFHLPFASSAETMLRVVSISLLRQHLTENGKDVVRLDLTQITEAYRNINLVNEGLASRIQSFASGDAGANALVSWHSVATLMLRGCRSELKELITLVGGVPPAEAR